MFTFDGVAGSFFLAAGIMFLALAAVMATGALKPAPEPRRLTPAEEAEYDLLTYEGGKVTVYESKGTVVAAASETLDTFEGVTSTWR